MTVAPSDSLRLGRFIEAQERDYATALAEIQAGSKRSHWIWYILPQIRGLGFSGMSQHYGITSLGEARAYLAHPVLGARLRECVGALLAHAGRPADEILGAIDAIKFRSCLTLFIAADGPQSIFAQALDAFFSGEPDPKTIALLQRQASDADPA